MCPALSRLERVELRDVWKTEAGDFTPWLAKEENIRLLGDAIEVSLEVEAQEKNVGPFKADILCKDTASNHWVLIENQLERTDHTHLGQLLTYSAGLEAVTIVWIAAEFTDEHRAALDWLNEITDERFSFFGLAVELWRIGASPIAPKFNVVCKPNNWSKTVREGAEDIGGNGQIQLKYWSALRDLLVSRKSFLRAQTPRHQHWTEFSVGRTALNLYADINLGHSRVRCGLAIHGAHAKRWFAELSEQREAIEREIGATLLWQDLPHKKGCQVRLALEGRDPSLESDWPSQHLWLAEKLESFHRAFAPRVKKLTTPDGDD